MTEQIARFNPGDNIPVFANAQINAGRFISIVGAKTVQGDYPAQHAAAGEEHPFGVAERDSGPTTQDSYSVERRINCIRPGAIARVQVGAEVDALDEVAVGANGKAVPVGSASLVTGLVGSNNAIAWTSSVEDGNDISVTIIDPAGNNVALSVDVDGKDIVVTGATDGASALTSTAAQVIAAIQEHDQASQLVSVTNSGASTGAGVVTAVAKTNLAGDTGVAVGKALTAADTDEIAECELY